MKQRISEFSIRYNDKNNTVELVTYDCEETKSLYKCHRYNHKIKHKILTYKIASPLIIAAVYSSKAIVKFLIEICKAKVEENLGTIIINDADTPTLYDMSALFCACICNRLDTVYYLFKKGGANNINIKKNIDFNNILTFACYHENYNLIRYFVKNKMDVNLKDIDGNTCLIYACANSKFKVAKYLLFKMKQQQSN